MYRVWEEVVVAEGKIFLILFSLRLTATKIFIFPIFCFLFMVFVRDMWKKKPIIDLRGFPQKKKYQKRNINKNKQQSNETHKSNENFFLARMRNCFWFTAKGSLYPPASATSTTTPAPLTHLYPRSISKEPMFFISETTFINNSKDKFLLTLSASSEIPIEP